MSIIFFFNDTATTEIYTLSLHDALPICVADEIEEQLGDAALVAAAARQVGRDGGLQGEVLVGSEDRKSTRLNSSHSQISYAVFCLKKKKNTLDRHLI